MRNNNPYPNEPTSVQPSRMGRMDDLPMKPASPPAPVADEPGPEVEIAETRQEEARTVKYAIGKLNDFLRWFLTVLEVTLAMRFLLKLIGADHNNLFAGFLYSLTDIVLFPFSTLVHPFSVRPDQAFEWSTLIAMLIYFLVFWAIRRFLHILITGPEDSVES
ncbi:hypothetical protein KSC_082640 [Ktedonobacter sp. SOSP1-52]|uniref:YggT family protein n=1 Tax=Ktedonobacter sp. SOSP1-52 TaxID=2778366 RepID=UPI00191657BE|nr:YggT family protein [Ktedonobacter sp. SOSP1-52]GHO69372.1 hypothetical protein KSC_082640 [Ktedonobacter sp. SOSP1-52]